MNEHTLRILEFDKVLDIISGYAASDAGKDFVRTVIPIPDRQTVELRLRETAEFIGILERGESPPLRWDL